MSLKKDRLYYWYLPSNAVKYDIVLNKILKKWRENFRFFITYGSDLLTTHRNVTDVNKRVHVICNRPWEFDGGIAKVERAADVIKNIKKYAFLLSNKIISFCFSLQKFIYQT